MDTEQIKDLLQKQQSGQLTDQEEAILDAWYLTLSQTETALVDETDMTNRLDVVWAELEVNKKFPENKIYRLWPRIAAAASILLFLSVGGYYILHKQPTQQVAQIQKTDILPGGNKATLTLANGQKIILTKNMAGKLAVQGQTQIQMNNGAVTYAGTNDPIVAYNTLTTKRKEQFPLILADGTEVTLDAASSITYPVAFNGKERKVRITGQAYFKVVHNDRQPFVVEVKGQTIRDIGTEFNINAYDDEPLVRTTLVQGSITIAYHNKTTVIKPGQEAELVNNQLTVKPADLDEAVAWKNNLFYFTGADLKTVMRQFARWYDVDVTYQGDIPDHEFAGEMSRNVRASEVFEALGKYGLKFKIDGKNVIVSSKNKKDN